jgi:hypothetical protein
MAKFSDWSPYDRYVQSGMVDGQFISGAYTVIASGPPRLANVGGATLTAAALTSAGADEIVRPIGIMQNVNLGHNRQFSRIFELGSERSYFISGRTIGQLGLSRVQYHGPSLLRMLYAYYEDLIPPTVVPSVYSNIGAQTVANPHDVKIPPGYENLYMNLASDLFNQPHGLLMYIRDSNEDTVGAVYIESCYVPNHTWATDSQGVLVQESAAIQFERVIPVAISDLQLITGELELAA